jgi:hypothetical protein
MSGLSPEWQAAIATSVASAPALPSVALRALAPLRSRLDGVTDVDR